MHELLRARYGQVPKARTHDRGGYGTCAGAPGARTAQHAPGLRPSAETNDLGWPDWPPDNGLKLAGPDGLQIVLKIRGAGALDVEAPDRAAPARVPPAVNDRAMNLDGPRGGCGSRSARPAASVLVTSSNYRTTPAGLHAVRAPSRLSVAAKTVGLVRLQSVLTTAISRPGDAGGPPWPLSRPPATFRAGRALSGGVRTDRLIHG